MTTVLAERQELGIKLTSLDEIIRFADLVIKSGLAPKGLNTPEAVVIAIQMGFEVGLPQMASLQNIAVINGRPSLWGDAQLAVVRATGELESFSEWYESGGSRLERNPTKFDDDTCCVCRVKRRGSDPVEVAFSVKDAKMANLWTKAGPWKEYPARMLKFRARSFALRDAFGDALRGMLSTEEAQDIEPMRTVAGRDVTGGNSQIPASNPLKVTGSSKASSETVVVSVSEAERTFSDEKEERSTLSNEIRETYREAEITLPRFEGMAREKGYLEMEDVLAGGGLPIEKLRLIHANRRVIAELDAAPQHQQQEGESGPWT